MPTNHPTEALYELLDGRLHPERRAAIESHLAACARCRSTFNLLQAARNGVRAAHPPAPAFSDDLAFDARVRAALDREDAAPSVPAVLAPVRRPRVLPLLAAAAAILAILIAGWSMRQPVTPRPGDLVAAAVGEIAAARAGRLAFDRVTSRPEELESYFARAPIGFPVRVLDLGMMGWRVTGGRVHRIGDHTSALYVYRDQRDRPLVCQMFVGRLAELPAGAERFSRGALSFAVYERNGITAVFWPEGEILCVLASDLPRDEVVALATAKAMARS